MADIIKCTAWDAVGKFSPLIGFTHNIRIVGGRVLYEYAINTRNDDVRMARIAIDPVRQINRYIPWNTEVELVPIEDY